MARNQSEKGPRRPPEMSQDAIAATIRGITVGQTFRVWYHHLNRYAHGSGGYEIDGMCLGNKEEPRMLDGAHYDFTCGGSDSDGISAKCNTVFYCDHVQLFHAIEVL